MMTTRALAKGAIVAALPVVLAACVTLLPKSQPAQLYRFGANQPAPAQSAAPQTTTRLFSVRLAPVTFERASASDQILTVEGDRTAYIGGARWVTSATSLFEAAVDQAFDVHKGGARLLARGETTHADYALKLDVRRFEAGYDNGQGAAPTITVEVYAALGNLTDPTADRQRTFRANVPADDNRVGAIVRAFDKAIRSVLGDLATWTDAKGAG